MRRIGGEGEFHYRPFFSPFDPPILDNRFSIVTPFGNRPLPTFNHTMVSDGLANMFLFGGLSYFWSQQLGNYTVGSIGEMYWLDLNSFEYTLLFSYNYDSIKYNTGQGYNGSLSWDYNKPLATEFPLPRNCHSSAVYNKRLYIR